MKYYNSLGAVKEHYRDTLQNAASTFRKISKQDIYLKVAYAYEAMVGNDNCIRQWPFSYDILRQDEQMP